MEKMAWDGPKWGREDFFPTNPGLANILGRTDLNFEIFYFFHFLDPKFLDAQVPKFWIPRSQNSAFPDFQKPGFPGFQKIHTAAGGRADGRAGGDHNLTYWYIVLILFEYRIDYSQCRSFQKYCDAFGPQRIGARVSGCFSTMS